MPETTYFDPAYDAALNQYNRDMQINRWLMVLQMVAAALTIIYLFERLTKKG